MTALKLKSIYFVSAQRRRVSAEKKNEGDLMNFITR
jgi:hypothetical protein